MRICLVTAEFHGLFKNGGIGTANTGLARELGHAGHDVTVAYVDPGAASVLAESPTFLSARARWREENVFLDVVPRWARLKAGVDDFCWSLSVLDYLRARRFDVVLFNECGGQGYYALLAKRAGVFANAPRMIVVTHGASDWARDLNQQLPHSYRASALAFFERRSVELADHVVSPSAYLVGWMRERGWKLPGATEVVQNVVPVKDAVEAQAGAARVEEIVFFGRLEARKGLEIFCDAVEALDRAGKLGEAQLTFLGKFARVDGVHSGVYLIERAKSWSVTPHILANLGQEEALDYLQRPGVLAVMPSLAENSPCVVVECLLAGVPFLASDGGGAGELIAEADRAACLVTPEGAALAQRLGEALATGAVRARMAQDQALTKARWRALVEAREPQAEPLLIAPRVTVCVSVAFDAEIEPATLAAIRAQTLADVQLIVVVYGAPEDGRREQGPCELHLTRRSPDRAAARNAAAALANGEWLAFVRERDTLWEPNALATLTEAARRLDVQAISGFVLEHRRAGRPNPDWDGEMDVAPLGPCLLLAPFENCLGDELFLVTREAFDAVGGYAGDASEAIEDRLLLTRLGAQGFGLNLAPQPLAWRRARPGGRGEDVADARRILKVFADKPMGAFAPVVESVLSQGPLQARMRATARLADLDMASREIALGLTFDYVAGAPESFPAFVRYCLARRRFVEALDFAASHDPVALRPLVETALARETERSERRSLRETAAVEIALSLKPDLVSRLRLQTAPEGATLTRDAHCFAALRLMPGVTVAKAPLACPPGTLRLSASVDFAELGDETGEVALVVAEPTARPVLTEQGPAPSAGVWWSGWRSAKAVEQVRVELDALPPSTAPRDVFVLGRNGGSREIWAIWREMNAHGWLSNLMTPSALPQPQSSAALPLHVLERGEVLTDAPDFPFAIWIPGVWTLHHPLAGRACVVRLRGAIPAGVVGVSATFSTENEKAHPIAFAFWLAPAFDENGADLALAESATGGGWTLCVQPFQAESMALRFDSPLAEPMDLYLATRVVGFDDVAFCHANWRDISILESVTVA